MGGVGRRGGEETAGEEREGEGMGWTLDMSASSF